MRNVLFGLILATAALAFGGDANARPAQGFFANNYQFCLKNSPGPGDCKYVTYQQCQASLVGQRGYCQENPGIRAPRS
jgi:Protein of unknown function (DUF3551)